MVDAAVLFCLMTIALEQARKRAIRRTLETTFLNHHVNNAMAQMMMASNLPEGDKDRYMREAVSRISQALFRVAENEDSTTLCLEVDLAGTELTRERDEREKQWGAKTA